MLVKINKVSIFNDNSRFYDLFAAIICFLKRREKSYMAAMALMGSNSLYPFSQIDEICYQKGK